MSNRCHEMSVDVKRCQSMIISRVPDYVWPDCLCWLADIHNVRANEALDHRTPFEKRHGSTPDISAHILFTFWQPILYLDTEQSYPGSKKLLNTMVML